MDGDAIEPADFLQPGTSGRHESSSFDPSEMDKLVGTFEGQPGPLFPTMSKSRVHLRLPKEGVSTNDGFLFHHVGPLALKQKHKDRLSEYGIKLKYREPFTPAEDKRIRRNWSKFAEKHGFQYEDARYYAGFIDGSDISAMVDNERVMGNLDRFGMWPQLCRKLETRSALQVQRRIVQLFDPHCVGLADPISSAEALRGYEILSKGGTIAEAAVELKRPVFTLSGAIYDRTRKLLRLGYTLDDAVQQPDLLEKRVLHPLRYRQLFFDVLKVLRLEEREVAEELSNSRSIEFLENHTHTFNWELLASKFRPYNTRNLMDAWSLMTSNLLKVYLNIIDTDSETDDVTSWDMAIEEALPVIDVSMNVLLPYLKSLRKSCFERPTGFQSTNISQYKMAKRLHKEGIINEVLAYETSQCPLYQRIQHVHRHQELFLLRHLDLSLTMREKIKILEMCYKSIMRSPDFNPSLKLVNLPRISRICYVENFVRMVSMKLPDWTAPKALQRYIRDPGLFHLFSKHSNNNGIINVQNIIKMRKQFFGNSACLDAKKLSGAEVALMKYFRPGVKMIQESAPEDPVESDPEIEATAHLKKRKNRVRDTPGSTPVVWGPLPTPENDAGVDSVSMFETPMVPIKRQKRMEPLIFPDDSTTIPDVDQDANWLMDEQTMVATPGESTFDESRFANETIVAGCQSIMKKGSKKPRLTVRFDSTVIPPDSPEKDSDRVSEESVENDEEKDNLRHLRLQKSKKEVKPVHEEALPLAFSQDDFMNLFS